MAEFLADDTPHRIPAVEDEDRLQAAFPQHIHLVEGIVLLQQLGLFGNQVYHGPGRCIPRLHGHAAYAQFQVPGLEAGTAVPRALPGSNVTGRGIGAGGRKGENQAPAALYAIPEGKEVLAETVCKRSPLHVRPAHVKDFHIRRTRCQQGIQLAQEELVVGRRAGRILDMALVRTGEGVPARPGGQQDSQKQQTQDQTLHHLSIISSRSWG